ncbi:MAG TPA: DinB family protein [Caldilineaceae bacterium]|nr:DinB family protein [Caldilineaceae bacterium]
MSALQQIQLLFDYNYALYDRIWESVMTLTDEQFNQDDPYAHGSLHNQLLHVAVVDTRWFRGLRGDPHARHFTVDPADYPTREAVHTFFQEAATAAKTYIADLDEAILEQPMPGMNEPQWQILLHIANHGTDHRAQILRTLHDLGAPTFPQDLIMYLWSRNS